MKNPFLSGYGGEWTDAETRLLKVKTMGAEDLRAVLARPDVQVTVRQAAERRLRKLARTAADRCPDCGRTDPHRHCTECGSTEHVAADCDMLG